MPIEINDSSTSITGDSIQFYRMCLLLRTLRLELKGIRHRGFSAYATIKREYNLKGNREKVLAQFEEIVNEESAKQERTDKREKK